MGQFITRFIDSPQDYVADYNAAFYITLVILLILLMLVVIATVFQNLSKKSHIIGAFNLSKTMHIF